MSTNRRTLDGRTCVVTGASRGTGRGIARGFGEHGAAVVVNYRSSAAATHGAIEGIRSVAGRESAYLMGQVPAVNGGTEW